MLDFASFARAERATGGFDTTVWRLERGGRAYALRLFRPGQEQTQERELLALGAARASGLTVPRVYATGTFEDRPAILMEWSQGRPLLDEVRARPAQLFALGAQFGRLHARLHQIPAPAELRRAWIDWAGPLEPSFKTRLEQLTATSPTNLLHLDFHPLNVLVHDNRVSALLDWTNAHAGDPRADFARTVTILRLSPPRGNALERAARLILEASWRYGYGYLGADMAPFYAWAGMAMQHDLAARFSPAALAHIERWTAGWLKRSQLSL